MDQQTSSNGIQKVMCAMVLKSNSVYPYSSVTHVVLCKLYMSNIFLMCCVLIGGKKN